jgi:hypothetical protein
VAKVSNLRFEKESQSMVYLISETEERAKNQFVLLHKVSFHFNVFLFNVILLWSRKTIFDYLEFMHKKFEFTHR